VPALQDSEAFDLKSAVLACSSNLGKRLIKSPKIHLIDSGVVSELRKQIGWSNHRVNLYHYRTTTGREMDILLEDALSEDIGTRNDELFTYFVITIDRLCKLA